MRNTTLSCNLVLSNSAGILGLCTLIQAGFGNSAPALLLIRIHTAICAGIASSRLVATAHSGLEGKLLDGCAL
jgi:hypothetical protein